MFDLSLSIVVFILFLFTFSVHLSGYVEGFVLYQHETPVFDQILIDEYSDSNLVYKIYDSIYFDALNGNSER